MRSFVFALYAALVALAPAAKAIPISWDMQATVTRTNLPALDIQTGDEFVVNMTLDSETPAVPTFFANGYGYFNVFDQFTVSINGHTLTLGPELSAPFPARDTNWLGTSNFPDFQSLQFATLMYEGDTAYYAETWFEFTDTNAFPIGSLPLTPPSLASARLAEFRLFSPAAGGGYTSIATANIGSLTERSVPEPSTGLLMLAGVGLMSLWRRRRVAGDSRP
jgi:hypothetical protein